MKNLVKTFSKHRKNIITAIIGLVLVLGAFALLTITFHNAFPVELFKYLVVSALKFLLYCGILIIGLILIFIDFEDINIGFQVEVNTKVWVTPAFLIDHDSDKKVEYSIGIFCFFFNLSFCW